MKNTTSKYNALVFTCHGSTRLQAVIEVKKILTGIFNCCIFVVVLKVQPD